MRRKITILILCFFVSAFMVSCKYKEYDKKPVWVIGNDIIKRINVGKFKDIEKYIDHLVTKKPYTVDGTRILEKLYPFVGKRISRNDMLDKWCAKESSHHSAFIFRGNYYIDQAWKHRGRGFSYTVTPDGRKKFRENLELAKNDLEKAYSMNSEDPNSSVHMVTVCLGLSRSEAEKETWFKRAIASDPIAYSAYARKQNYLRPKWGGSEEKDRAFAEYCYNNTPPKSVIHEIMLDYIIENYRGSRNKGNYYSDPSIIKTINDVAQRTLEIFPNSTSIRSKLAEIERFKGNYGKAIEFYSEILAIDPGNPDALSKRGSLYAGSLRKYDLAEADFKMSIESDPYSPNNYEELAKIARINGNYREAIEYFTMAIKRKPKAPQLYIDRGTIKRRPLREYASALEDFKQSIKLDSNHVVGNFYMALCHESMQQFKEAKKYCMKTLSILEARKPGKVNSLPPAFANDIKNKLNAMLRRLETGRTQFPKAKAGRGPMYPLLPIKTISKYVGTYELSSERKVIISIKGERLACQLPGQSIVNLFSESDTVFFNIPNRQNRIEFFKDENGKVTHLVLTQYGVEKKAVRASDKIYDREEITLSSETMSRYVGTYELNAFSVIEVTITGEQLFAQSSGLTKKAIAPVSESIFLYRIVDAQLEFFRDETGKVSHLVLTQGNSVFKCPRKDVPVISKSGDYGLTEKTAIKTGGGPRGERAYLDMLCGANGEKIKYKRLGSCCAFETTNSPFAMLDIYEVTYEGLSEPAKVYLNMYDPPTGKFLAPAGFRMISSLIKNQNT